MTQTQQPLLDRAAVRVLFEPAGDWAKDCGREVRKRRERAGMTLALLAELAGTNVQTIYKVERGLIVPREYLRASIAYSLAAEVTDIWRPMTLRALKKAAVA